MNLYRLILSRAAEQHGLITPADALAVGGTRMGLVTLERRGIIERLAHGVYRISELAGDRLEQHQEALLRFPTAVLSHDTALDLHELCNINPARIHVTVPCRLRVRKKVPSWLVLHRRDLDERETAWHEGLAIVTPARAILDGIETNVGQRFIDEALEAARRENLLRTSDEHMIEMALLNQRVRQLERAVS
jgi:predicted transcriptional regulator of viral defense system